MRTAGIEAEEGPPLDLERAVTQTAPEQPAPAATRRRGLWPGLLLSLALHLLPLLLLLPWRGSPVEVPAEVPAPIPVRLVVEQPPLPPPAPDAQPQPAPEPPQGRLTSEEVGAKADEPNTAAVQPPDAQPDTQSDAQSEAESGQQAKAEPEPEKRQGASVAQPQPQPTEPGRQAEAPREPELRQAANFLQPQHEPTLLGREALALPAPSVEPLPEMPVAPVASRQPGPAPPPRPRPPTRAAAVTGPSAVRDEYLAYLVTLVRPHLHLLPPAVLNGRRGTTSLAIRVLSDGTIARIAVSHSSGHPDIDARVIQVVAAVGRFPPLPPWVEQPSWDLNFHLRFPFPQAGTARP